MNHVQVLESRQLLSATFAAVKPKPTPTPVIPTIVGTYNGNSTQQKPTRDPAISQRITISAETKKGAFSGTDFAQGDVPRHLAGTINAQDQIAFTISTDSPRPVTLAGTYHPTTHVISGSYEFPAIHNKPAKSGVFSITLVK